MLNTNKTCQFHQIKMKNHAKTSLLGNYHVNKLGFAYCEVAVMVMINDYNNSAFWPDTLVDIRLCP